MSKLLIALLATSMLTGCYREQNVASTLDVSYSRSGNYQYKIICVDSYKIIEAKNIALDMYSIAYTGEKCN